MYTFIRTSIVALALIGLLVGASGTALAVEDPILVGSPACDALNQASENANSNADKGLDRAKDENGCDLPDEGRDGDDLDNIVIGE